MFVDNKVTSDTNILFKKKISRSFCGEKKTIQVLTWNSELYSFEKVSLPWLENIFQNFSFLNKKY